MEYTRKKLDESGAAVQHTAQMHPVTVRSAGPRRDETYRRKIQEVYDVTQES